MAKKTVVETAKERFGLAKDRFGSLREKAVEDTKFVLGDSDNNWQWPDDVYRGRSANKPCLTINITAQHCNQVINQIRQNRPSAKVVPQDGLADIKTAEILGGMLRSIQSYSNADTAHDVAAMHSLYGGEGFWRVLTEYESPQSFDQVISVRPLVNPQLVFIDPDAIEPDRSDARWGIIFEDVPKEQAEGEYGEDEVLGWGDDKNGWCTKDTVRRAEYFYREDVADTLLMLEDGTIVLKSDLPEGAEVKTEGDVKTLKYQGATVILADTRKTERVQWKWARIVGGRDTPEEEKDWPGQYLPIIAVVGTEVNVNGEIVRKGLVRDLKDAARMVNYSYSAAVETVALQTKTPWLAAAEAIEGYEEVWGAANVDNRAMLPWNASDESGNALPKPERIVPAAMATAQVQMLQLSVEQARAASGQQSANFGIKSEAQSGIGIQRLKAQGEIATFHFPDNLARGLKYEAKVILDLIPKIYDRKRIVRILGLDGKESAVLLDPQAQGPQEVQSEQSGVDQVFNPNVGRYDVAIDTGPSFQTQRQESAAIIGDLAAKVPLVMNTAPDLVFKAMDFPMAQDFADRFAKTLDPKLNDKDGGPGQKLQQAMQQLQQMQQQEQQVQQVIGKMQTHIDQLELDKKGKVIEGQGQLALERERGQTQVQIEQIRAQVKAAQGVADHGTKSYDAQTDRVKAIIAALSPIELQALAAQTVQETLAAQPLQPEMEKPTIPIPVNPLDGNLPWMAATGANPGPSQDVPLEGNENV